MFVTSISFFSHNDFKGSPHQDCYNNKILDSSKPNEFADDNFKFDENGRKFLKQIDNTVGKGEIARYEQFSFSHSIFKRNVQQTRKNEGLYGKELRIIIYLLFFYLILIIHMNDSPLSFPLPRKSNCFFFSSSILLRCSSTCSCLRFSASAALCSFVRNTGCNRK